MDLRILTDDPRRPAFLLGLGGVVSLASAFTFQLLGYDPCQLCLWQRWPFAAVIALALLAVALKRTRPLLIALLVAMGLFMASNSGLAFYHTGVEQHWWANAFDCGAPTETAASVDALREQLMATDYVPCDKIPWQMFGISIAAMNIFYSAGMALFAFFGAWLVAKR
jgi:disulfide bond formation protein DsbB